MKVFYSSILIIFSIFCHCQNKYEQSILNEYSKANSVLKKNNKIYLKIINNLKEPDFNNIKEKANEIDTATNTMVSLIEKYENLNIQFVKSDSLTKEGIDFYDSYTKLNNTISSLIPTVSTKDGEYKSSYEYLNIDKENFVELFNNKISVESLIILKSMQNSFLIIETDILPMFIPENPKKYLTD